MTTRATRPDVFVETGQKKVFAGAIDWPGWCRGAKDEEGALAALIAYAPRYAGLFSQSTIDFPLLTDPSDLSVVERVPGNSATDFGVADAEIARDADPFDEAARARAVAILDAIWRGFDRAVAAAEGKELRKGPRGGGRDRDKIVRHVLESDASYLRAMGQKFRPNADAPFGDELARTRDAVRAALEAGVRGEIPEHGPRGGKIWTPRYFVRRLAWHHADHLWEIEDRIM